VNQSGQGVPHPFSFRILVQRLAKFLHRSAFGLDFCAEPLHGEVLNYPVCFEDVQTELSVE
jgi:hypothetical protein